MPILQKFLLHPFAKRLAAAWFNFSWRIKKGPGLTDNSLNKLRLIPHDDRISAMNCVGFSIPSTTIALVLLTNWLGCTPAAKKSVNVERSSKDSTVEIPEEEKDPVRPGAVQAELNAIRAKLDEIARDLVCEQDQECVALGANDNACGITTEWLIFSTRAPRYIEVEELLSRSFYLDNTYPNSRIEICGGPSQPIVKCMNSQCQTVPFPP